ncbi:MAG: 23S rRNA (adenine(2503)-C(2))-methyltransferase RlmN [Firmicutes bacterium]|nr:23S rRNA (adenine(2503)-C(2))-methyltransferase RlmN [Bacillota bacterium]
MTEKINLKNLQLNEMEQLLTELGEPKFRAKQIFAWLYKGVESFEQMTNVPQNLKEKLQEAGAYLGLLSPAKVQVSKLDGTRKYLFELEDGNAIESVFMKYKYGNTICISSQAGCRMGCKFCASTIGGLSRNLEPGEMLEQLLAAERDTGEAINHIVVMGTGEPFDNYENLSAFIRIINDKNGRNLGMRNITISTCGLVPMIEKFGHDFPQVNLAISLHAPNNTIRNSMMPVNKAHPMETLIEACRKYTEATSRRVTFEYTLVKGVNDSERDALELASVLKGMLCHVNLIPLNKVEETGLDTTDQRTAQAFRKTLENKGIPATIRRELGDDIDGACGQLRLERKK